MASGVIIDSIYIENFRSIKNLNVEIGNLSIFVGKNDSGKSNILRALNLFFNGETNPGVQFNFNNDYNFFAEIRRQRAKEVVVRVTLYLPESYHKTNGQYIVWTKKWRESGFWGENFDYHGLRKEETKNGNEIYKKVDISDKSNVHSLLRKIEFEYVPAVKDSSYFDDLRGRIYGIISEVAAKSFHTSSSAFEESIAQHLRDLTNSITDSLGFETRLALPRDLSDIFKRLDFLSGEKSVSLNSRGDGIKARHIPLILKFMADMKSSLQQRGGQPFSAIWAYEEPENNLEISSAFRLAEEFLELSGSGKVQIIITTHSPVFYDLGLREDDITLNFVVSESGEGGTDIKSDLSELDESLGTLAMLTPRVTGLVSQVRQQEQARHEASRFLEQNTPKIFVEGESDKIILQKAMEVFFPEKVDNVSFETKKFGAGHSYVIDMLVAWRSFHKHHADHPKAVGVVDSDCEDKRTEFNKNPDNIASAKCFCYPKPAHLISALRAGYNVPVTLEALYPRIVWKNAEKQGHLVERNLANIYPDNVMKDIFSGKVTYNFLDKEPWSIFAKFDFKPEQKVPTARRIVRKEGDVLRQHLECYEKLLRDILVYLNIL